VEANGEEFQLAPVYKINAVRMLMMGKANMYFDIWEADSNIIDAAKSYEELLAKVRDSVTRRKLDTTSHKTSSMEAARWTPGQFRWVRLPGRNNVKREGCLLREPKPFCKGALLSKRIWEIINMEKKRIPKSLLYLR
jgi:hypothetical protein